MTAVAALNAPLRVEEHEYSSDPEAAYCDDLGSLYVDAINAVSESEPTLKALEKIGVAPSIATGLTLPYPTVGKLQVQAFNDGFFEPSLEGAAHYITPVAEGAIEDPDFDIEDICAWRPSTPRTWLLNKEGVVLGRGRIRFARNMNVPAELYATPLEWLRNRCAGAVVVNWKRCMPDDIECGCLICPDRETANSIIGVYQKWGERNLPEIRIRNVRNAA